MVWKTPQYGMTAGSAGDDGGVEGGQTAWWFGSTQKIQ